jgi:hypothetical protein
MRFSCAVDTACATHARAADTVAGTEATRRTSRDLVARARRLRSPRCSTPYCVRPGPWKAYLAVRCTVGTRRRVTLLRLPIVICDAHRRSASLVTSMRRYAPALLTSTIAAKGMRWPNWRRARVVYVDGDRDLTTRAS